MLDVQRFLTERDREVFALAGYGRRFELGKKPMIVVIDITYEFTGTAREPILEAARKIRTACGEEAWQAVDCVQRLLKLARAKNIPIAYTAKDKELKGPFDKKNSRSGEKYDPALARIVDEVAPQEGDYMIKKVAPSAFFGTNLNYMLVTEGVDTVIVVGGVTSGCVRATAIDAFSYGYKVAVVQDGVFDRGEVSGAMALFELGAKNANILSEQEAADYIASL